MHWTVDQSTDLCCPAVQLEVHYSWRPADGVRYLDGSCLLYGPGRVFLEYVDWQRQGSHQTQQQAAVTHSGDIMDFQNHDGKNTAHIQLSNLGLGVEEIFITLSAWMHSTINDIEKPYVQVGPTGAAMC